MERFRAIREYWNDVYKQDSQAQLFLSWQWLYDQFERRGGEVFILAIKEVDCESQEERFQAFMPVRRQLHLSKREARFMLIYRMAGNHWADYTGLICVPNCESTAIPQFGRYLASITWERLYLECLSISSPRLEMLLHPFKRSLFSLQEKARLDSAGVYNLLCAPRIELPPSFDAYLRECLSANTRQRVRRYMRKFESDNDLAIRLSCPETQGFDLRHFERLWTRRWKGDKGSKTARLAKRYVQIIAQGLANQTMQLHVMEHHGRPISFIANYTDPVRRSIHFYAGSRDQTFTGLPTGLLLHVWAIRSAVERGFRIYDFLSGDESYKYSLGATNTQLHSVVVSRVRVASSEEANSLPALYSPEALRTLKKLQGTTPVEQVEKLYRQLRDVWPEDLKVVRAYEKWKMQS